MSDRIKVEDKLYDCEMTVKELRSLLRGLDDDAPVAKLMSILFCSSPALKRKKDGSGGQSDTI